MKNQLVLFLLLTIAIAGNNSWAQCPVPAPVFSAWITSSNSNTCAGWSSTFVANTVNAGSSPTYQWKVNGFNAGPNSSTFIYAAANGDIIGCVITGSNICATPASVTTNNITANITPVSVPAVSISASTSTTICAGTSVTFTATPTNGGSSPSYQWKKNNINVGTNSATYADASLNNSDKIQCIITGSAPCTSPPTAASNQITMTVNPVLATSVSISSSVGTSGCSGVAVTFTATPTNGGTNPSYQWKKNGINVGINSSTYTDNTLTSGNTISCVMTSNYVCPSGNPATSNSITMTINPVLTASVSISASATTICAGTTVTFTATPVNGGTTPSYQWKVNGVNAGTNSATFVSSTLQNNAQVTCAMTSNATCALPNPATSNTITMTVNPLITPWINIVSNVSSVCAGHAMTFTASSGDAGSSPSFQWKVNGANMGSNSSTFVYAPANGQVISCVVTSNYVCPNPASVTSNSITAVVYPVLVPTISISASATTICNGTTVTFTATTTNAGFTPVYQWKKNNINVGSNSSTYVGTGLVNGDDIQCYLTSNATCASPTNVTSNRITMTVNPLVTPSITIASAMGTTGCAGLPVLFTSSSANTGSNPSYQWRKNGVNIGPNNSSFTATGLVTGDVITCLLTSNAVCPTPATVSSNSMTMNMVAITIATISIAPSPDSIICPDEPVLFSSMSTNAGTNGQYQWLKNGVNINGAMNPFYFNNSFSNGDIIQCKLTSSNTCVFPVISSGVTMTVNPAKVPAVSITVDKPAFYDNDTSTIKFQATPISPGTNPTYQWRRNSSDIAGAISAVYMANAKTFNDNDQVYVVLHSDAECANPEYVSSNTIALKITKNTGIGHNSVIATPELYPNPNTGTFVLKGKLSANASNKDVLIEAVNALGQVLYQRNVTAVNGALNEQINLNDVPNGIYMLQLSVSGSSKQVIRFSIQK